MILKVLAFIFSSRSLITISQNMVWGEELIADSLAEHITKIL